MTWNQKKQATEDDALPVLPSADGWEYLVLYKKIYSFDTKQTATNISSFHLYKTFI